jgi:hypothetical protein
MAKAQADLAKATTNPARLKALNAEAKAYKELDPAQRQVATNLEKLQTAFARQSKAVEPQILDTFNGAIAIASKGLVYLTPLAREAAIALTSVEDSVKGALGSPFWKNFGETLGQETGPAIKSFAVDLGNVAHGIAGLVQGMLPLVHQLEPALESLTGSFAKSGNSQGFRDFVTWAQENGPHVVQVIGDIGSALGVVTKDALPVGEVLLDIVDDVAKLVTQLDHINPLLVTFGVGIFSASRLLPHLTGAGKALRDIFDGLSGGAGGGSAAKGASGLVKVATRIGAIGAAAVTTLGAVGALTAGIAALAVAAGTVKAIKDTQSDFDKGDDPIGNLRQRRKVIRSHGDNPTISGDQGTGTAILAAAEARRRAAAMAKSDAQDEAVWRQRTTSAVTKQAIALGNLQNQQLEIARTTIQAKDASDKYSAALHRQADAFTVVHTAAETALEANLNLHQSYADLAQSVKDNGHSLDINTQKGRNNIQAIVNVADAINQQDQAWFKSESASKGIKVATDEVSARLATQRQHLIDVATSLGLSKDAAEKYAKSLLKTPKEVKTSIEIPAVTKLEKELEDLRVKLFELTSKPYVITVQASVAKLPGGSTYGQQVPNYSTQGTRPGRKPFATGGTVYGPGTGTSDSILARLSNGEGVVTARAMKNLAAAGVTIDKLNSFAAGGIAGLSTGGLPTSPIYSGAIGGADGSLRALMSSVMQFIQRDLPQAMKGGASAIASSAQQMIDDLANLRTEYAKLASDTTKEGKKAFAKLGDAGPALRSTKAFEAAEKAIERYAAKLQKASNQNDTLTTKIQANKDAMAAYKAAVASSVVSLGDFTNYGFDATSQLTDLTNAQDVYTASVTKYGKASTNALTAAQNVASAQKAYNSAKLSGKNIVADEHAAVAVARKYAKNILFLKSKGLGTAALQDILAKGPEQGAAIADALAHDLPDIKALNAAQNTLASIGNTLGIKTSAWTNQAGKDVGAGILKGLQAQEKALVSYMAHLGDALAKSFKKSLGIKSPSTVFAEAGEHTVTGYVQGIERARRKAHGAVRGLASEAMTAVAYGDAGRGSGSVGGGGVHIHGDVTIASPLDAAAFWQHADAWTKHNGRTR